MNGNDLLAWFDSNMSKLESELTDVPEDQRSPIQEQIDFINQKKSELEAFRNANPALWEKGLIEKTEEETVPAMAFSDSMIDLIKDNKSIAFSDIDIEKLSMEDVENELKNLYEFKGQTIKALSDIGADSIESIKKVVDTVNDKALDVEAKSVIRTLIADPSCKITKAMEDWSIDFYKKDKEAFKKFVADAPVAFSQTPPKISKPENKHKNKINSTQEEVAKIMGCKPEEVFKD